MRNFEMMHAHTFVDNNNNNCNNSFSATSACPSHKNRCQPKNVIGDLKWCSCLVFMQMMALTDVTTNHWKWIWKMTQCINTNVLIMHNKKLVQWIKNTKLQHYCCTHFINQIAYISSYFFCNLFHSFTDDLLAMINRWVSCSTTKIIIIYCKSWGVCGSITETFLFI
jgi:hypothetical protein